MWQESVARNIPQICTNRERIKKGDCLVADIEELENMNASEIHPRRLNAKEVLTPQRVNILYSQKQTERQNCQEETTNSENPVQGGNKLKGVKISVERFRNKR